MPLIQPPTGSDSPKHRPLAQVQAVIGLDMHAETRPSFAHCACTAAGSVRLLRLTHAGMAPQQLPTFLTAQSALVLQL